MNPGRGGWGAVILSPGKDKPVELKGGDIDTTNNRMELTAAITGLRHARKLVGDHPLTVFTDSKYLRDSIRKWLDGWISRGWKLSGGGPVRNADLWEELHALTHECQVQWKLVKAHVGNRWNTRADRLAKQGVPKMKEIASQPDVVHLFAQVVKPRSKGRLQWRASLRYNDRWTGDSGSELRAQERKLQLLAVLRGLQLIGGRSHQIYVFTTSEYVYHGMRTWVSYWQENDWKKKAGGAVWYKELWQQIVAQCEGRTVCWFLAAESDFPAREDRP